jgi:hypothetical protein
MDSTLVFQNLRHADGKYADKYNPNYYPYTQYDKNIRFIAQESTSEFWLTQFLF